MHFSINSIRFCALSILLSIVACTTESNTDPSNQWWSSPCGCPPPLDCTDFVEGAALDLWTVDAPARLERLTDPSDIALGTGALRAIDETSSKLKFQFKPPSATSVSNDGLRFRIKVRTPAGTPSNAVAWTSTMVSIPGSRYTQGIASYPLKPLLTANTDEWTTLTVPLRSTDEWTILQPSGGTGADLFESLTVVVEVEGTGLEADIDGVQIVPVECTTP
jgi:hypothetical protein